MDNFIRALEDYLESRYGLDPNNLLKDEIINELKYAIEDLVHNVIQSRGDLK